MRVGYLLADPGIPVGGTKGASVHVAEVCRALVAAGVEVTLVAQRVVGPPPDGVDLVHVDPGPLPKGPAGERLRIEAARAYAARAADVFAATRPDVVYERLALFFGGGRALAARLGVPRLVEVNAPVAAERAAHFGLVEQTTASALEREALVDAAVLAVSFPLARWALRRGAASAAIVPNGVDLARFNPAVIGPVGQARRVGLGLAGRPVVGFVGSLKPWHGVDVLLAAAGDLAAQWPELAVLVVGDGPAGERLRALAGVGPLAGRVHFTGAVAQDEVPGWLAACDIAVAPYLPVDDFYFSPLKVAEAMAAGVPVVSSRFPPIESMLADTGLLVTPGDPVALAAAVHRLLADPTFGSKLAAAARDRAVELLGWDRIASRILSAAQAELVGQP